MESSGRPLTRTDKALLIAGALGICICIYLLFFEHGSTGTKNPTNALGKVTFKTKDTRQKSDNSFEWAKLKEQQEIFVGDSIYSGEDSQVEIGMKAGGAVQVGENSLVTFDLIEKEKVMDLELGNFRVKVDGQMKIAVHGKLTVIDGKKSEVQVYIGKNKKPQLRLISGEAKVVRKEKTVQLKPQVVASLPTFDPHEVTLTEPAVAPSSELPREVASTDLTPTTPAATQPSTPTPVYTWRLYDLYDVHGHVVKTKYPVPQSYKLNGQTITPHFQDEYTPTFTSPDKIFATDFAGPDHVETFPVNAPPETLGFIFERSSEPSFPAQSTESGWSKSSRISVKFQKPGTYHYRFRAVTPSQELSPWSQAVQFNVLAPKPVIAKTVKKKRIQKTAKVRVPQKRDVAATEPVQPVPATALSGPGESSSIRLPGFPSSLHRNDKYRQSQISAQGFLWTLQSTEQRYANQTAPVASGAGARGLHWFNNHGLEWNLKSGFFAMNSTGKEAASLKYLETRYHYRFFSKAPFNFTRELQWSLFGGAEVYRNSGTVTSRQYDLLKFGSSLEFPLGREWTTGGEIVIGTGADGSRQQQISGNINYFINPDWSLGVGYRLHMFEAGSAASTPTGILPYREGYTEGTSFLNYYF